MKNKITHKNVTYSWLLKFVVLALLGNLIACSNEAKQSPEQRLRATIEAMVEAAKNRSLDGMAEHISDDYSDHNGYTKKKLKQIIQLQIIRNQNIFIHYKIKDLQINDNQATVELSAMMATTQHQLNKKISGITADKHNFSLLFTSPDKQKTWLLNSASWQRD